jgi:hypothetical protein
MGPLCRSISQARRAPHEQSPSGTGVGYPPCVTNERREPKTAPPRLSLRFSGWLDNVETPKKQFFEDASIVLDANVLLALYEIGADARGEVLAVLTRVVGRLWVPHQAALEFCRNRKRVVIRRTNYFGAIHRSYAQLPETRPICWNRQSRTLLISERRTAPCDHGIQQTLTLIDVAWRTASQELWIRPSPSWTR